MGTKLKSNQGTEICNLLRKYGQGDWWYESIYSRFNRHDQGKLSSVTMSTTEALNIMFGIFRRMETEREIVMKMLPHYDPSEEIWMLHHSEIEHCFDQLYPGCAEPLTDDEIQDIIHSYKKGIQSALENWEGELREAIELEASRTMEIESCQKD